MRRFLGLSLTLMTFLGVFGSGAAVASGASDPKSDEFVLVQDRYSQKQNGILSFSLEANVFEWGSVTLQKLFMEIICEYAKKDCSKLSPEERQRYLSRTRHTIVDHESGKTLAVQLAIPGQPAAHFRSSRSGSDGWIRNQKNLDWSATISESTIEWEIQNLSGRPPQKHSSTIVDLDSEGLSIICDIDDTIRESHVLNRARLLTTILFEPFKIVDPVLARIRELRSASAAHFVPLHFVSAGPSPMYSGLREGLDVAGLRQSEIYLRPFRFKDRSSFDFFKQDTLSYKVATIKKLFETYPKRRFVLIGDSGEKDPEVYREILRLFPSRVEKIIIRRIQGANNEPKRFEGLSCEFIDETINKTIGEGPVACQDPVK